MKLLALILENWEAIGAAIGAVLAAFGVNEAKARKRAHAAALEAATVHPDDPDEQAKHVEDALLRRHRRAVARRAAKAIRARMEREALKESERPTRPGVPTAEVEIPGPPRPPSVHPGGKRP